MKYLALQAKYFMIVLFLRELFMLIIIAHTVYNSIAMTKS